MELNNKSGIYFWVFIFCFTIIVWSSVFLYGFDGKLKVYFLNVGQGDAIFIETPDKFQVLVDGGPDNSILSELSSVMPFYDKSIDLLVLTHPQKDHIFGLIDVLKRYEVKNVLFSSIQYKSNIYDEFKKIIKEKNINFIEAKAGKSLVLGDLVKMDLIYPFFDASSKKVKNPNDISLAFVLTFLEKKFLFAGDAELKEEIDLVNSGIDIDVDVLKLNHHGSNTSNSELFLEKTSPDIAVISVGKDNPYKHPSKEVLERIKDIKILRTDINGKIIIKTDGFKLKYQTEFN